jgi:hypothetical protein
LLFILQQLVDSHLRLRLLVYLLDDDLAVEAVTAVLGWQAAGNDDGAGRDLAVEDLAGEAVVDPSALVDVGADRD